MREVFKELGLSDRLVVLSDGKKGVDFVKKLFIDEALRLTNESGNSLSDIAIIILDINMPVMLGNEAIV